MKSELREDQLNNVAIGPKLDTHLLKGDMMVMKAGAVLEPGNIFPPKAHTLCPHLCHHTDTVSIGLDMEKTFFLETGISARYAPTVQT